MLGLARYYKEHMNQNLAREYYLRALDFTTRRDMNDMREAIKTELSTLDASRIK